MAKLRKDDTMIVGRIEVDNDKPDYQIEGNNKIDYLIEYSDWNKMKSQIELETLFNTPFRAFVYTNDRLPDNFKLNPNSKIIYLPELIPANAETFDRYYIEKDKVVAIYYNPDGGIDGIGEFMQHNFPYEYILECDQENNDDETFVDSLYGDAINCPTYCIDIGTERFETILENLPTGIVLPDMEPATIRKFLVDTANDKLKNKEYELKIAPVLYLKLNSGETKDEVIRRAENMLETAGFDYLDMSINRTAEIRDVSD